MFVSVTVLYLTFLIVFIITFGFCYCITYDFIKIFGRIVIYLIIVFYLLTIIFAVIILVMSFVGFWLIVIELGCCFGYELLSNCDCTLLVIIDNSLFYS